MQWLIIPNQKLPRMNETPIHREKDQILEIQVRQIMLLDSSQRLVLLEASF